MSLNGGAYRSRELAVDASEATALEQPGDRTFAAVVVEQVEISAKYSGYINRQKDEVARSVHYENLRLPKELDYMQVPALSIEARQKLEKNKPETLGQASRISGITPATISLLLIHLKRNHFLGRETGGGSPVAGEVSV